MPHRSPIRSAFEPMLMLALGSGLFCGSSLEAQQLIGYVSTKDADVSTASDVMDGHAVLMGSVAVTAKDHTAPITLGRGGSVRVCQTSILHLTESKSAPIDPQLASPLLLSLDRGAVEGPDDRHLERRPDDARPASLRPFRRPARLRVRVARNGDTCVENRGSQAPTLAVTDPFGEALYELRPGQHVLFEHGSLREVVDHETTPCAVRMRLGCRLRTRCWRRDRCRRLRRSTRFRRRSARGSPGGGGASGSCRAGSCAGDGDDELHRSGDGAAAVPAEVPAPICACGRSHVTSRMSWDVSFGGSFAGADAVIVRRDLSG